MFIQGKSCALHISMRRPVYMKELNLYRRIGFLRVDVPNVRGRWRRPRNAGSKAIVNEKNIKLRCTTFCIVSSSIREFDVLPIEFKIFKMTRSTSNLKSISDVRVSVDLRVHYCWLWVSEMIHHSCSQLEWDRDGKSILSYILSYSRMFLWLGLKMLVS